MTSLNNPWPHLKAVLKLILFFSILVWSILALSIRLFFTSKNHQRKVKFLARKQFCIRANDLFGVKLIVKGELPPEGSYLYISNHRSFYDPVALLSHLVANPVSKAEVSDYPVIGWGARLTEVLMLDRSAKENRRRMKQQIYESLLNGTNILVYPEGTTSSAEHTASFKKGAFESAIRANRAVIPVAMEYPDESYYWIHRSLYQQFLYQMVNCNDKAIYMSIGVPVTDDNPMELMEKTRNAIDEMIVGLREFRRNNQ